MIGIIFSLIAVAISVYALYDAYRRRKYAEKLFELMNKMQDAQQSGFKKAFAEYAAKRPDDTQK